MFSHLN